MTQREQHIEPLTDREIVKALISDDSDFAERFFYVQCKPLLSKIAWTIFNNNVSIDDLSHDLYLLCKEDNWHRVKGFSFKSTFFGWLRVVATHHFIKHKEKFTNLTDTNTSHRKRESVSFENASDMEIEDILEQMASPTYRVIIRYLLKELMTDHEVRQRLSLSPNEYKRKKEGAFNQLVRAIKNKGPAYEAIFICQDASYAPSSGDENESWTGIITKIDVQNILNLLDNDRYRFVIESLVLQDRKREDVAEELCTTVQNLDNIKSRALKRLAELVKIEIKNGRL